VAELVDALGSGSSGQPPMGVQVPPFALFYFAKIHSNENNLHPPMSPLLKGGEKGNYKL
jgi:hypothetical protein